MAKKTFSYYYATSYTQHGFKFVGLATFRVKFRYVYTEDFFD
jgi:hypothetical protein